MLDTAHYRTGVLAPVIVTIMLRMSNQTLIPSTTAGSLPKPAWLAEPVALWAPWRLEGDALLEAKRDALRLSVHEQEAAGLSIIGDGEQTRKHFVTEFIEHLQGVDFVNRRTVRIRNRYDASVPVVIGPVSLKGSVFAQDAALLRAETGRKIKFTLPGPMTMIDTLHDAHYGNREQLAREFAAILNQEAHALQAAGVDIVQFDEPAFNVYFDEVRDWGIEALERAAQGLSCKTAVHICYGYGIEANIKWKQGLGETWRQYENTFPALRESRIDQVSLECQNSRVPIELIGLLKGKDVMVGAIDVASHQIETPDEVAETLRKALNYVAPSNLIACTNCGMVPLPRAVAAGKLKALAAGAAIVRAELGG